MYKYLNAFKIAFPLTLPIAAAFLFLGISYGFYMCSNGFSVWYPFFTSALIFAGSMEFLLVNLLLNTFNPLYCFLLTITVNSRHLFYGISMLEKFKNTGWKKFFLIFGMCDESFAINYTAKIPDNIDNGWFMTFVTLLNQIYWVIGATLGGFLGDSISINTQGLEFTLTALFVAIFVSQWQQTTNHNPAILGVIVSILCLLIFGKHNFMSFAIIFLPIIFISAYYKGDMKNL